jgi:hypothetical protein
LFAMYAWLLPRSGEDCISLSTSEHHHTPP